MIDSSRMRSVAGNVHRLAQAKYDRGEADPRTPMSYMVMLLQPSPAQQADLAQLVAAQQNPASPQYHKWLTPEVFGERFGLSQSDLAKISSWLKAEGFSIDRQVARRQLDCVQRLGGSDLARVPYQHSPVFRERRDRISQTRPIRRFPKRLLE